MQQINYDNPFSFENVNPSDQHRDSLDQRMREFEDDVHRQPSLYGIPEDRRQSYNKRKSLGLHNS